MTIRSGRWLFFAISSVATLLGSGVGYAQFGAPAPASGGAVVVQTPGGPPQVIKMDGPSSPGGKPELPPGAKPEEKKEGDAKVASPGEKTEEKKDGKPAVVKRPTTPPAAADPTELDIRPDADGRVRFNFRGQTWADVLDWLATVSRMSLDWQELPGDYLNLITQRSYSLDEARDLINRHLLARGYTLLVLNDVLTVAKTENINAALVPRVEPEELASRLPHEYVKVSFPLDWMIAETAVEELKPMLSPNGKLTALKTTNRLEALDAAANLRELYAVLTREQSTTSQERLVKEFVLKYARATDVSEQLKGLLGLDSKSRGPQMPMSPQQMEMMQQQQQQMMMQMQQQEQQRGGRPSMPGAKGKEDVNLVVNPRRNSILANAPPDKMALIVKAVEQIDVPLDRDQSLLLNVNRMQIYRLAAIDPETLIKTLQESGDLDPTTRLEADRKNNAIIAYAPLTDHLTIRTLVEKLDGSGRQFEVIRLRRLEADYVAGTITFMMGQEEKKEERPRYFGFWDGGRRSSEDENQNKFRVDADIEGNRLLMWANEIEMEEVRKLLVKLGEIPAEGGNPERIRVIDAETGEGTPQLLEQIRRVWPTLAPNPMVLPPPEALPKPTETPAEGNEASGAGDGSKPASAPQTGSPNPPAVGPKAPPPQDSVEAQARPALPPASLVRFAQLVPAEAAAEERPADAPAEPAVDGHKANAASPDAPPASVPAPLTADQASPAAPKGNPPATPPPVQIAVGPDGRLVISSQDTAALDLLEELLSQLVPPRADFKVFPLKYASSLWVKLNLQDYFEEEPEDKNTRRNYYYFDNAPPQDQEKGYRLSKRKPLKFIDDLDTNTILVVGASAEQLKTIEELIRLWDTAPPSDTQSARMTAVFPIRYSKAETVAETVKEVYVDLLSSNDKALQKGRDDKRPGNQTTYIFGESGSGEPDRRTQVSFKGKLSIGVDSVSNTLLVSTEGQNLMENVSKMIEALDEAAKPVSEVEVVTLRGNVNAERVRKVLAGMLGEKIVQPGQGGAANQPPGGPQPGQPGWVQPGPGPGR
ncbi:MAG: hypothetical protein MUF25_02500 [Pirellulaceae bacterium]|nr:hypothetical protein [Pirellulaceae bacterium]